MPSVKKFVKLALNEDLGRGDLFSKCVVPKKAKAVIRCKEGGIFAGVIYAKTLLKYMNIKHKFLKQDGDKVAIGDVLLELKADDTVLLSVERTLLNTLQHASGIATLAHKYNQVLKDTKIKILDTRKTRPLLRNFEKYASQIGGIHNHRMGLDDCLMIKDTHLKTLKDLKSFVNNARQHIPITTPIEIECATKEEAKQALECGVEFIMCDNMGLGEIAQVIELKNKIAPQTKIEVSGNITLNSIQKYKDLKIDFISTGSVIHQAVWIDFSMKIID